MSRPIKSSGIALAATNCGGESAANFSVTTMSPGSRSHVGIGVQQLAAGLDHVFFQQRLAYRIPLRRKESKAHAAADHDAVGFGRQRLDDAELVGHLRSAEHHRVGALGRAGQLLAAPRSRRRPACRRSAAARWRRHRPKPACGAPPRTRRRRKRLRARPIRRAAWPAPVARRRPCWSRAGRSGCSPAAGRRRRSGPRHAPARRCRRRRRPTARACPAARPAPRRPGASDSFGSGPPFGPAQVGGDHDLGARVEQRLQRGHRRCDAAGVGDVTVVVERHVQVGAHQHAAARNTLRQKVFEVWDSLTARATCRPARPGQRGGWSSPTRCRTRTPPWPGCRSPWSGRSRRSSCAGR